MTIVLNGTTGVTTPALNTSAGTANFDSLSAANNPISVVGGFQRNKIINGDMRIDQRNAGTIVTPADGQYTLDRWVALQAVPNKYTVQQNAGSITPPAGFSKYLGCTSASAYTVGASEYFAVGQIIEGFNTADLAWGTANAVPVTLSFWVRSSLTGTFGGVVKNVNNLRSYPFSYTISAANTWEQKSITIAGDTSGTYATGNTGSIKMYFGLGVGSTYSGTAGSWSGGNYVSATGATSVVGTSGATFYITGVQLEAGSVATPFEHRQYGTELALCQRYFQKITGGGRHFIAGNGALSAGFPTMYLRTTMRAAPSFSYSSLSDFTLEGITGGGQATPTGLAFNAGTTDTVTIQTASSGSSTGTGVQMFGANSSAWTSYSAEL